jgi:toxin HigB-1
MIVARPQFRLQRLDAATNLTDLGAIRGNRLEALKGDRDGQHSVRINDRWRICFSWLDGNAHNVEIVAYFRRKENGRLGLFSHFRDQLIAAH